MLPAHEYELIHRRKGREAADAELDRSLCVDLGKVVTFCSALAVLWIVAHFLA